MTTEPIYPALARLVADSNGSKHHLAERAELFDAERRAPLQRRFNELAVELAKLMPVDTTRHPKRCDCGACMAREMLALWERLSHA